MYSAVSLSRHFRAISLHYKIALLANSLLLLLMYAAGTVAFDRHSLYQSMSFIRNDQLIHFQKLGNSTRSLMRASADGAIPNHVIGQLVKDVDAGIEAIRKDIAELDLLRRELDGNLLERLSPRAEDDADKLLDFRIVTFLNRAKRVADVTNTTRRTRYAFWGQIDFAVASEGAIMQEFLRAIQLSYAKSRASVDFARETVGALIGVLFVVLLIESLFIFRPLLRKLRVEYRNKVKYEEQLTELALKDGLTGLSNRAAFNQHLDLLADATRSPSGEFSLLLIDLDHFKAINDTLGHLAGDAVLKHVATQLRSVLRADDIIARLGGDEFAVLLPAIADETQLRQVIGRIETALATPLDHEGRALTVAISLGGAVYPSHGRTVPDLTKCADIALHTAKSHRNHSVVYNPVMMAETREQTALKAALPAAADRGEFVPFYQPKVDLRTGAHIGFEALVRWIHPVHGLLPPGRFLPLLDTALLERMTAAVIDSVARDVRAWRDAGLVPGPVAINMPEAILSRDAGCALFERAIGRHGVGWNDFAVEITEDVFLNRHAGQIAEMVARLNRQGIRIALDDFGTGFASLTHLRAFPFDEIKIDRSFTADIGQDIRAEQIVKAVIDLARNLGKQVVAEGIETVEQRDFLVNAGCRIGQGYLFSRPLPFDQATLAIGRAPPAHERAPTLDLFGESLTVCTDL